MGAVAFNTYELIKTLEGAGMSEEQAEAITTGILRAHEVAGLATKADLRELQAQNKADLQEMRAEMREEMAALRTDLQELRAETKADVQGVKADMREMELRIDKKLVEMKGESMLVRWMLGLIMAGIAGLIIKTFFGT